MSTVYHQFYSQYKGKKTRSEINLLWKEHKARAEAKTSVPGKRIASPVKTKPVRKVTPKRKLYFNDKNLPMSPIKKPTKMAPKPEVVMEPVVTMTFDAPLALKIASMVSLGKLYQILQASPDLGEILRNNVRFWANVYLKNFGTTMDYRRTARSINPKDWTDLVRKTYLVRLSRST